MVGFIVKSICFIDREEALNNAGGIKFELVSLIGVWTWVAIHWAITNATTQRGRMFQFLHPFL